jgi:hypothetical protein
MREEHRQRMSEKRPKHRWKDNIRIDPREIGREGVYWIHVAQGGEYGGLF